MRRVRVMQDDIYIWGFRAGDEPLCIALGSKNGLTDVDSAGKIREVLDAKKNSPHEFRVRLPSRISSDSFEPSRAGGVLLTCTNANMNRADLRRSSPPVRAT